MAFDGIYKPQNEQDTYGLGYALLVVPLVKAVQELNAQNQQLLSIVHERQTQIKVTILLLHPFRLALFS